MTQVAKPVLDLQQIMAARIGADVALPVSPVPLAALRLLSERGPQTTQQLMVALRIRSSRLHACLAWSVGQGLVNKRQAVLGGRSTTYWSLGSPDAASRPGRAASPEVAALQPDFSALLSAWQVRAPNASAA